MSPRVLRVYHSAVVSEYRHRERLLRDVHGYDVHLVSPPSWPEGSADVHVERDRDVPMHILRTRGRHGNPILFWYEHRPMRRLLREFQPDIVDLHEEPYSLAVAAALRAIHSEAPSAAVCVYTAQNIPKRYPPPFRQFEQRAYRAAAAIYPCSAEAAGVLRSKGYRGRIHNLPLGVSRPSLRLRTAGPVRVGFVGRLEPYKGGHIALKAFAEASKRTDATLEFIGGGSEECRLQELAGRLQVDSRVAFCGPVSQEQALEKISALDILLVPSLTTASWKEQFGRVAAQALIAGTVVVASDSGSLREVVGDAGVLVPEGDVAIAARRLRCLILDPRERALLSERGRQRAEQLFTWEAVVGGVHHMYQEALNDRPAGKRV